MTDAEILAIVIREALAIGEAWRFDWNDFDGRTLRRQLAGIADWAASAQNGSNTSEYTEGSDFLESHTRY